MATHITPEDWLLFCGVTVAFVSFWLMLYRRV
jgi:hypothetical protein